MHIIYMRFPVNRKQDEHDFIAPDKFIDGAPERKERKITLALGTDPLEIERQNPVSMPVILFRKIVGVAEEEESAIGFILESLAGINGPEIVVAPAFADRIFGTGIEGADGQEFPCLVLSLPRT